LQTRVAVAPEHSGRGHRDLRARRGGARDRDVDVLDEEMDGHGDPAELRRSDALLAGLGHIVDQEDLRVAQPERGMDQHSTPGPARA